MICRIKLSYCHGNLKHLLKYDVVWMYLRRTDTDTDAT